jgi:hypothetical protein
MADLWSRVTSLLTDQFALEIDDAEIVELVSGGSDGEWELGAGLEDLGLSLDEFICAATGMALRADLVSLGLCLHSEISFFRSPHMPSEMSCLCLSFGTLLHRQLYPDPSQMSAEDHPKRALLRLGFAVAEAVDAAAFLLEDNNQRRLRPIDPDEFARRLLLLPDMVAAAIDPAHREMLPRLPIPRYSAIDRRFVSREALAETWRLSGDVVHETTRGFVVVDLL